MWLPPKLKLHIWLALLHCCGNVKWCGCSVKQAVAPQKARHGGPSNSTPKCLLKKTETTCPHKNSYMNVHKHISTKATQWE